MLISPKNYDKELNIPTWNYISIHAYGQGRLITSISLVSPLYYDTVELFIQKRDRKQSLKFTFSLIYIIFRQKS